MAVISEAGLLEMAGPRSFERGVEYVEAVHGLTVHGRKVTASVQGTDEYIVVLTLPANGGVANGGVANGGVTGICDCPYGQEGFFCKHCVAVGLALLRREATEANEATEADDDGDVGNLVSWLASLNQDELFDLVVDRLVEDAEWRERLDLKAAAAFLDTRAMVQQLASLLDSAGFGEYGYIEEGESRRYASRVDTARLVVDQLAADGQPALAAEVATYAIELVAAHYGYAADPARAIWRATAEVMNAHLDACLTGEVAPDDVAGFLAERMLSVDDLPRIDLAAYRKPLGPAGEVRLRELLTDEVAASPTRIARAALEEFLRFAGDVDALVAEMAAGLSPTGAGYLRIAEELERAGRNDEALEWAERGLREAPGTSEALADFVVKEYLARRRLADAVAIRRDEFGLARTLTAYEKLRLAAEFAGIWPETREWALDRLRADAETIRPQHGLRFAAEPVLVDVLMSEGDADAAWAAAEGIASESQWRKLADLVAATRPADALAVYLRELKQLRPETGQRAYERMADLLVRARDCHRRLGTEAEFDTYLRYLRLEQKRKRKLTGILDARGLVPAQGLATSKSARTDGALSGSPALPLT